MYGRNETGGDSNHPDENKRDSYQNIGYLKQMTNRNILRDFDPNDPSTSKINGLHYDYQYNKKEGWQAFYNNEFVKNVKGSDIARIEGLLSADDIRRGDSYSMFNLSKVLKDQEQNKEDERLAPTVPGTVGLGSINIIGKTGSDQVQKIKSKLEKVFNNQFKEDFNILPIKTTIYGGGGMYGGSSTTTVTPNKIRIKSKDGSFDKIYNVGTNATREIADQITGDFKDYITPIPKDLIIK